MRQLARRLKMLRGKSQNEDSRVEDYIDISKFDELVLAVKDLCGFDAESRLDIGIPSLALNLGHSLKRCAQVLRSSALRSKDEVLIKQSKRFLDLFEAEWANKISSRSLASLGSKKQNKLEYLPLAEDLTVLKQHLERKMADLGKSLKDSQPSPSCYVALARIIIFNKRRSGEMATLQIQQFEARPNWAHCSATLKETALERRLCERQLQKNRYL